MEPGSRNILQLIIKRYFSLMDYWLKKCNTLEFMVGRVLVIVTVIIFISLPGLSVNSQAVTELAFQPEVAEVMIGDTGIMKLDVKNGVNLSGYDLVIRYDPGVIELKSWAHGTYLSNLAVMRAVLQPGIIELAAVQVGKPGVTGDGTLLSLTFTALKSGDTPVYLESIVLAAADGQRVYPEDKDGLIIVKTPATETRTPTITLTNSSTPTTTFTPTLTRTAALLPSLTLNPANSTTPSSFTKTSSTPFPVTYTQTPNQSAETLLPLNTNIDAGGGAVIKTGNPVKDDINSGQIDEYGASIVEPEELLNSDLQQLNRLLWIFAAIMLLILGCFIFMLLRSKHKSYVNH
jgi:hypothetical protein